jgi:hypothetical protein
MSVRWSRSRSIRRAQPPNKSGSLPRNGAGKQSDPTANAIAPLQFCWSIFRLKRILFNDKKLPPINALRAFLPLD